MNIQNDLYRATDTKMQPNQLDHRTELISTIAPQRHGGAGTYAAGGLGSKSTLSIVKIFFAGSSQNTSGLAPGTSYSSEMATWSLDVDDQPNAASAEAVCTNARNPESFIFFCFAEYVGEERDG